MGPCTASSAVCHAVYLPWALYRLSHACCQLRNQPWAPVPPFLMHAMHRSRVCLGPVRTPIAAVSIATLCHVPLSGLLTLLSGFQFLS
ncbi:unnamed protein product [Staurois parvus]|uniref:Uncharacterized protein n=1 Tax=Staurois parvus TaxID=386267 RepID=A0ABN9H5I1_9NEOB|nr:unnamed protein product [Staurois parvus]